MISCL
ncbi:hypothetical protein D039_4749A, partial [Vibrio parahaemolyticus EKP-028]